MARVRTRDAAPIFFHENTVRRLDQGALGIPHIFAFSAKKIGVYPT